MAEWEPTEGDVNSIISSLSERDKKRYNTDKAFRTQKNKEYHDRQYIGRNLPAGAPVTKQDVQKEINNQVAESIANTSADITKEQALANIEAGRVAAHGEENERPELNPLVKDNSKVAYADTTPPKDANAPASTDTNEAVVTEAKKDPVSRYKMRSILDAYNAGEIDKDSRDYLILDTLSNFTRNLGKDMGNVAAAYSGGTVDNERGTSMWDKRNQAMAQSAIEGEQTGVEGSREKRAADQQAANLYTTKLTQMNIEDRRKLAEKVKAMAEDAPEPLKTAAYSLANNMLTGQPMSAYDIAGTGLTGLLSKLIPIPGI